MMLLSQSRNLCSWRVIVSEA